MNWFLNYISTDTIWLVSIYFWKKKYKTRLYYHWQCVAKLLEMDICSWFEIKIKHHSRKGNACCLKECTHLHSKMKHQIILKWESGMHTFFDHCLSKFKASLRRVTNLQWSLILANIPSLRKVKDSKPSAINTNQFQDNRTKRNKGLTKKHKNNQHIILQNNKLIFKYCTSIVLRKNPDK